MRITIHFPLSSGRILETPYLLIAMKPSGDDNYIILHPNFPFWIWPTLISLFLSCFLFLFFGNNSGKSFKHDYKIFQKKMSQINYVFPVA